MDGVKFLAKLDSLDKNLRILKDAVQTAEQKMTKEYIAKVGYLVNGMSYMLTEVGRRFIAMNIGETINDVVVEPPLNARDIFVKLGEIKIIPTKAVPHLNRLITQANANKVDIKEVGLAMPSIELFIFYVKHFMEGVDLFGEEVEEVEVIRKVEDKKER